MGARDLVDRPELLEHGEPDHGAGDLAPLESDGVLDPNRELLQLAGATLRVPRGDGDTVPTLRQHTDLDALTGTIGNGVYQIAKTEDWLPINRDNTIAGREQSKKSAAYDSHAG